MAGKQKHQTAKQYGCNHHHNIITHLSHHDVRSDMRVMRTQWTMNVQRNVYILYIFCHHSSSKNEWCVPILVGPSFLDPWIDCASLVGSRSCFRRFFDFSVFFVWSGISFSWYFWWDSLGVSFPRVFQTLLYFYALNIFILIIVFDCIIEYNWVYVGRL